MESSSTEEQLDLTEAQPERKKPGPKPKKDLGPVLDSLTTKLQNLEDIINAKPAQSLDELITRIHDLENLVIRMAHNAGTSHSIIRDSGLTPYSLKTKDMTKFKVG